MMWNIISRADLNLINKHKKKNLKQKRLIKRFHLDIFINI